MAHERLIGGRYRIVRKIAEGGMGEVYEAQHNLSKKSVALKILFAHIGKDEAARQRFLREVSAPAQIGHDAIVEVYDAGFDTQDGSLFVAMELLEGEPLRDRLARGGVPIETVLDWFEAMLDPLSAAHRKGIVHRDLKPENVFLQRKRDGSEVLKILDFGIARDLDGSSGNVTHTGIAMGTPHYMAPEQAMSAKSVTAAADVWALGAMLYEALCGRPPFEGETASAIVVAACTRQHAPLAQVAPHVPPALGAFVDRCLSKEASGRPSDAGRMLEELRQVRGKHGAHGAAPPIAAGYAATASPGHAATASPGHAATASLGHAATASPGYAATASPGYAATASPGYAAADSSGYAATASPGYAATAAPGPATRTGPLGGAPLGHAPARTAVLPQTSHDEAGPGGGGVAPGWGTPPPGGSPAPGPGEGFGRSSGGGFGAPGPGPGASGPTPGSPDPYGARPAFGGPPGGPGTSPPVYAPAKRSGRGLAIGLVVAALFGGLLLAGGAAVVALILVYGDDATTTQPATSIGTVRIQTDVPAGELFVDGTSRGPIVPGQQFRLRRGAHQLEVRERGVVVARAAITITAGQDHALVMNRTAQAPPPVDQGQGIVSGDAQTFRGELQAGDETLNSGEYADGYHFDWTAGTRVRIDLDSPSFDTYLILESPSGAQEDNDDREPGDFNSTIETTLSETGRWRVVATSFAAGETGSYTLVVRAPRE